MPKWDKVCLNCTISAPNGSTLQSPQVQYWPALLWDERMLPVPLETDSNTADRRSSAEETGPIVFAICKTISGNFKRKERINKASLSLLKQTILWRKTCADLSKVGVSNGSASYHLQMFQKRVIGCYWKVISTHLREKILGTKQILSDSPSCMPSQLLATPEHCLIGVQTLLEQEVPPF